MPGLLRKSLSTRRHLVGLWRTFWLTAPLSGLALVVLCFC
jgi:hypothetical protein